MELIKEISAKIAVRIGFYGELSRLAMHYQLSKQKEM